MTLRRLLMEALRFEDPRPEILRKLNVFSRTNAIIEISKIDFTSLASETPVKHHSPDHAQV